MSKPLIRWILLTALLLLTTIPAPAQETEPSPGLFGWLAELASSWEIRWLDSEEPVAGTSAVTASSSSTQDDAGRAGDEPDPDTGEAGPEIEPW